MDIEVTRIQTLLDYEAEMADLSAQYARDRSVIERRFADRLNELRQPNEAADNGEDSSPISETAA